ncbi:rhodanese-like domain-containing protein [Psychroserpens sp. Hel_I_66]|uniref:rhodanese-like domain-containing protein n=1 Tax=Psychroserpens sp. Hel_I_66 TaxID=1250004 RepID=UPI000647938D|nr:rhodanese-like domain-containing protein [Psychroserpens sp. Hel_I_66]
MKNKILMYCIVLFALTFSCEKATQNEVIMVSAEQMQELIELEDIQVVDVRTSEEYKTGFIAHSQNIDYLSPTFEEDLTKLDKSKPILVYCKSGGRSGKCTKKLQEAGFVKIYDLEGGIAQWKFHDLEIKKNE